MIEFESGIRDLFAAGKLPFLVHLSGGNEEPLLKLFKQVKPGDWIFSGHRSHYHYLLAGGSPDKLREMIKDGDSMFVFDSGINFLSSSILAGMCGIAAGVAHELKAIGSENRVWCFLGDGAEDEGHFYEAARFVEGWELPCTFVIEDNNRSVDTDKRERHGKYSGFLAMPFACITRYHYVPSYPHGGAGLKTMITFDPEIVAKQKEKNI